MRRAVCPIFLVLCWVDLRADAQQIPDLNTILMESTFKIQGPKHGDPRSISYGTAFLMAKPKTPPSKDAWYVLVSAGHVFDDIEGDSAYIVLRDKQADGTYTSRDWKLTIRKGDTALYVKHPGADVAVVYVNMPDNFNVTIVPQSLLANDDTIRKFEIHPGDEVLCLGFPLYVSTDSGFPILRSGRIASYPIIPTSVYKTFNFNFEIFDGNSGGPVYFIDRNRYYAGVIHMGEVVQFVIGIIKGQVGAAFYNNKTISLATVVHATYIKEAIDLLPPEPPYK